MKRLAWVLLLALPLGAATRIVDVLYMGNGLKWTGRLDISWPDFTTAGSVNVAAGSMTKTIGYGRIDVTLQPNQGATPSGVAYTVIYRPSRGNTYTETWVVPDSGTPVTLSAVRQTSTLSIDPAQITHTGASDGWVVTFESSSGTTKFKAPGAGGPHHATHQHGGSDEVATATAAANAIPKAGSGGTLDPGWIPTNLTRAQIISGNTTDLLSLSNSGADNWVTVLGNKSRFKLWDTGAGGLAELQVKSVYTGDGTASSAMILPELAANGTDDTRIYGADSQASSGCIVWPVGTPSVRQVAADSGSTATMTDGKVCRVFTWQGSTRGFGYSFFNGGQALSAGWTGYLTVPYACTIAAWNIAVDSGTASVDVWKKATGTAVPTVADTITGSAMPAISSGTAIHSTTLTGWTTSVAANDIVAIHLEAVATSTVVNFTAECNQ